MSEPRDEEEVELPSDAPVGGVLSFENPQVGARGLLRSGAMVSAVALIANGFNVIFHFATARLMGPGEYSLLTTMFAVFLIATVPLLAVQATITREMASLISRGDEHGAGLVLRSAMRAMVRGGLILVVVAGILFLPLMSILNVDRPLPILAVAVAFLVQIPGPIASGALQASERFWALSWTSALQSTLKLAAGVGLAALGFGASAVTFGFAAATVVTFAAMVWVLRPYFAQTRGHELPARRIIGRYALGAAIALGFNTALLNTDLVWARGSLSPDDAGLYAAASVATSMLLLIPIGLNTVLFARVARLRGSDGERPHLNLGLLTVVLLSVPCVAIYFAFPTALLHLGFGTQYDDAAPLLGPLALAMAFYALTLVYLNHLLALGRDNVAIVMALVLVVQQLAFLLHHGSSTAIVDVQIVCSILSVLGCELFLRLSNRNAHDPEPDLPAAEATP